MMYFRLLPVNLPAASAIYRLPYPFVGRLEHLLHFIVSRRRRRRRCWPSLASAAPGSAALANKSRGIRPAAKHHLVI
jgi:hypothetical protein